MFPVEVQGGRREAPLFLPRPALPSSASLTRLGIPVQHPEAAECDCKLQPAVRLQDNSIKTVVITITTKTVQVEKHINPAAASKLTTALPIYMTSNTTYHAALVTAS